MALADRDWAVRLRAAMLLKELDPSASADVDAVIRPAPTVATPETAALGRDEHERVVAALRRLPERQREAVALRYYLDLSEADIAAAMGVSAGSVKSHLHRGLASLARDLGEEDR